MASPPPLPKIEGDVELLLDVFTHDSLRLPETPLNDDYGDTHRLALLGAKVLEVVVTTHWFHAKSPGLPAEKLLVSDILPVSLAKSGQPLCFIHGPQERVNESLSDTTIDSWMNAYGLKSKLRIAPSAMESINSSKDMRKMFETYVGAVYHRNRNGFREIQEWISRLIDPNGANATLPEIPDHSTVTLAMHAGYSSYSAPPPPPPGPPPPMPAGPPFGLGNTVHGMHGMQGHAPGSPMSMHSHNPGSPMLSMVSVALFNQKATQNGFQVTYPAEHTGPPHAPVWKVRCCLNGKEYGYGEGKSQKIAKEEAARRAWAEMRW